MVEYDKTVTEHDHNQVPADAPVGNGFLSGPGFRDLPVSYVVVDDRCFYDGCIYMGRRADVEAETARVRARSAAPRDSNDEAAWDEGVALGVVQPNADAFLWPNAVIPYTVDGDLPQPERIDAAIAHMHENTGVRFVRRTAGNAFRYPNYVEFVRSPTPGVSWSQLGMRGGRQEIAIADGHPMGVICHEIEHALGFLHEQTRTDRDQFVDIRWENITPGRESQFQIRPGSRDLFDYDYGSIMHYHRTAFSRNGQDTIVPLQPGVTIGQRSRLSFTDRQSIAKLYERFFTRGYSGVWRPGTGAYGLWVNARTSSFLDKWQEWSQRGLRLADLHVRRVGRTTRVSGVFDAGTDGHALWLNASWSSFLAKWREFSGNGLRLVDIHVHRHNGRNRYSGVFRQGGGGYGLWANATWSSFHAKWEEWSRRGLRLVDLHVHRVGGTTRYTGVFRSGSGGYALWANATWTSFVNKWRELSEDGLRLIDLNHHQIGTRSRYSGVFAPGSGGYYLWANVTWESFRAKWQELAERNMRLVDFEIVQPDDAGADAFDPVTAAADESHREVVLAEFEEAGIGALERAAELTAGPAVRPSLIEGADGIGGVVEPAAVGLEEMVEDGLGEMVTAAEEELAAEEIGGVGGVERIAPAAPEPAITGGNGHAGGGVLHR